MTEWLIFAGLLLGFGLVGYGVAHWAVLAIPAALTIAAVVYDQATLDPGAEFAGIGTWVAAVFGSIFTAATTIGVALGRRRRERS